MFKNVVGTTVYILKVNNCSAKPLWNISMFTGHKKF